MNRENETKNPTKSVADLMTADPITMGLDASVTEAAEAMRAAEIGDVIVTDGGRVCGIVTDRDIVVRAIAAGKDPQRTMLREICSEKVIKIDADAPVADAVRLMREEAIRRLPVVTDDQPVGVLSLGDLAIEQDPRSVLADISAAPADA
jgi:CBS domain-containing protein